MQQPEPFRRPFKAMGSPCEIQVFAEDGAAADRAIGLAIAEVERLEQHYSRYREDSFLSAINRAALAGEGIAVDKETALLLDYADTCFRESDGLFDISSGILRRAWDFKSGKMADQERLDRLLPLVGWNKIAWDGTSLAFPVPGMELDFGGVAKEYAVDCAATILAGQGIDSGFVNLGGDLRVLGPQSDGQAWRVGIRHHRQRGGVAATIGMERGAMASSGDYERCIIVDGIHYGHILNPRTGWPVTSLASVSVIADFCLVAGSAATIAMLKDEAGPAWLEALGLPHRWTSVAGDSGGSF